MNYGMMPNMAIANPRAREKFRNLLRNQLDQQRLAHGSCTWITTFYEDEHPKDYEARFSGNPGFILSTFGAKNTPLGSAVGLIDPDFLVTDVGVFWTSDWSKDRRGKYFLLWEELLEIKGADKIQPVGMPKQRLKHPDLINSGYIGLGIMSLIALLGGPESIVFWLCVGGLVGLFLYHQRLLRDAKASTLTLGDAEICWYGEEPKKVKVAFDMVNFGMEALKTVRRKAEEEVFQKAV